MDIISIINEKYQGMTKKQKQVVDFMAANPNTMSFITLKELSAETKVTELTILHACQALGYENFNEVKYEFRKYLSIKSKVSIYQGQEYFNFDIPEYELNKEELLMKEILEEEKEMLDKYIEQIDVRELIKISGLFYDYSKVMICGRGISHTLGQFLSIRLASAEIGSILVNTELNDEVYGKFPLIDEKTLVVVIFFPDYYYVTEQVAEYAQKANSGVLWITDKVPPGALASHVLIVPSTTRMFLNTLSAPMVLINALTSVLKVKTKKKRKKKNSF